MIKTRRLQLCLFLLLIGAASVPVWASETLVISGGTTPQVEVLEPRAAALLNATGVRLEVRGVGTGRGMLALWEGTTSVAAVGDSLPASIEAGRSAARDAGRDVRIPDNLVFTLIGRDELLVIVHKSNPVTALTRAQLKDMATGRVTNWREVGGADLPIRVVTTRAGLIPGRFFQSAIMDGAAYVSGAIEAQSPREVITWVSRTPGGFGMATDVHMRADAGDTKAIRAPAMIRPLGLVTIGPPTGAAKKVVDFYRIR